MSRTITVKGTGRISLKPDLTVVTMTLTSLNKDYDKSMAEAADRLSQLRAALVAIGFSGEDLKTTNFNVNTEYESQPDKNGRYRSVFKGYACRHGLKLEFGFDTKRLSAVLSAVAGCIAEPELNIRFTVKDREAAADELLRSAAGNARHKAEVLAAASGVRLTQLLAVNYDWADVNMYSRTEYAMDRKCMAMPAGGVDMSFTPEDVDLSDSAAFIWEIE